MLLPILATLVLGPQAAQNLPRDFKYATLLCNLSLNWINESSGIACSRTEQNIFFTHNDAGDSARFFKFNAAGTVLGVYNLQGTGAADWEDMASAVVDGVPYLYFGDIGDNNKTRLNIRVHRLIEPLQSQGAITNYQTYVLTYPDVAHDAEAMMVHPGTGDIYIVTKTPQVESIVFKCPKPSGSGNFVLQEVGRVRVGGNNGATRLITGGDISADGKYVLLRTYYSGYEFKAPEGNFDGWCNVTPNIVTLRSENQGEAICYSPSGTVIYTTSEGVPCPVSKITMKKSVN